ncbi:uncharacterized protein PFL1_00199 [Pseudozyma flocculosa PF-1]|uniref:Related to alkaline phosphatase D n=1 Tax=Pseudozyma flocculosa TaxID=84751 RepID=A0A5C3ETT6_9BASI|nr:uncharacterized protein PFL1_00199 [Pseudozyma flocculosa PF-1]EPQ32001.1 hypothetical protein PFL1_00199 [Pseudozyma flocculosa PF-1]SPO35075.1 related to alkaline phosphatase D precursor [Pseudozyma flocculosa]
MQGLTFTLPFLALLSAVAVSVSALPQLERNIAYRSPSRIQFSRDLAHDVGHIGRNIRKRHLDEQRTLRIRARGKGGYNPADQLAADYDGEWGSDGKAAYRGKVSFPYNVASGDPYDDSAILWTHPVAAEETDKPICLRYQTSTKPDDWSAASVVDTNYAWTTSEVDYSFKVETTGLKPKTQYWYRFQACHDKSQVSQTGSFKTIPEADDAHVDKLRLAVFSCSNLPFGYFNAYQHASDREATDYAVHVGDYIYEARGDGVKVPGQNTYGNGTALNRVPRPNHEIVTLDDYRQRYASYREDKSLQALHASKAWFLVWDDHEVADNAYNHGTADGNNTASGEVEGVRFTERKLAAVKAYFEWMPIRQVDTTDSLRIWRQFHYGKLADLFLLDTRNFDRDITDVYWNTDAITAVSNDTARSLMGGKQEKWFYDNLIKSKQRGATWKIVGQQIIVNPTSYGQPTFPVNRDSWDGYNANRRRFFDTLTKNKIDDTILLAGDSHAAWVSDTIYEEYVNNTSAYDPESGRGSIAVEFAGTAVSSPSSYGQKLTPAQYTAAAAKLVSINPALKFADGQYRGYFELEVTKREANAYFYGIVNNTMPNSDEIVLASFNVKKGANKLTRPINGGQAPKGGALQSKVVDYAKQKWNGTAFA